MGRGWLIAKHEYRKMVSKRSFLVGTLGMPLLIIIIMGIGIISAVTSGSQDPVGYVDHSGYLDLQISPQLDGRAGEIELVQFPMKTSRVKVCSPGKSRPTMSCLKIIYNPGKLIWCIGKKPRMKM
jgi:ABC-type Na+ efflux pump permease subunit